MHYGLCPVVRSNRKRAVQAGHMNLGTIEFTEGGRSHGSKWDCRRVWSEKRIVLTVASTFKDGQKREVSDG